MSRKSVYVPFGYTEPQVKTKGTVFVYGTGEHWSIRWMKALEKWSADKGMARVILFPQHEDTLRRMDISSFLPYHERIEHIKQSLNDAGVLFELDEWEGKRKKYTPMDTSLRFLTDKYTGPYFLLMDDLYASRFSKYKDFKQWIKKLRLVIEEQYGETLPMDLKTWEHRIERIRLT